MTSRSRRLSPVPETPVPPAKRRGLVLGAGGVLGSAYAIGALRALERVTGWDPRTADVIVGTSGGSVLAALLGGGVGTEQMVNHQRGIVAPGDPRIEYEYDSSALPPLPRPGLGSHRLLRHTVRHPLSVTPLAAMSALIPQGRGSVETLRRVIEPFVPAGEWAPHPRTWIVAMDFETGRRVPFGRRGEPEAGLSEAVMASCAIPGWYAPVTIGGRRYVDGGACSTTSIDLVAHLELDEVYVIAPMASLEYDRPRSAAAKVERYLRRGMTKRMLREADHVRRHGAEVVMLLPGPDDLEAIGANLMDPRRREAVLETSLNTSAEALQRHFGRLRPTG